MKTHKYTMIFAAALSLATACGSTQPGEELEQPPVTPSLPPVEQGDFIQIAGGTFTMGSPSDERWRETDEEGNSPGRDKRTESEKYPHSGDSKTQWHEEMYNTCHSEIF